MRIRALAAARERLVDRAAHDELLGHHFHRLS